VAKKTQESSSSSTDWGWVAFGILAAAVVGGAIVWLVRRHSANKRGGEAPSAGADLSG
jgi:hypothetical protein